MYTMRELSKGVLESIQNSPTCIHKYTSSPYTHTNRTHPICTYTQQKLILHTQIQLIHMYTSCPHPKCRSYPSTRKMLNSPIPQTQLSPYTYTAKKKKPRLTFLHTNTSHLIHKHINATHLV